MSPLPFYRLSPTQFEEFSFDLLQALEFVNVDWRKGTPMNSSPADKGRDIVCQQLREDVDGSKHFETWFVDCKHYKKGVPPTELDNLLTWAQADRPDVILFMISGFLSNPAKEHLENYRRSNRPAFKIKYWERPQLERMARKKITLQRKHNLTEAPIRSAKKIMRAQQELAIRYSYEAVLAHVSKEQRSGRKADPNFAKQLRAFRKLFEKALGKNFATRNYAKSNKFKDGFFLGRMAGKLSALQWVLGDEWDLADYPYDLLDS